VCEVYNEVQSNKKNIRKNQSNEIQGTFSMYRIFEREDLILTGILRKEESLMKYLLINTK